MVAAPSVVPTMTTFAPTMPSELALSTTVPVTRPVSAWARAALGRTRAAITYRRPFAHLIVDLR
jgi:hypothetical protein